MAIVLREAPRYLTPMFVLSKVLWPLVAPANLLIAAIGLGTILLWTRWRRAGRWLVTGAALVFWFLALFPVGAAMMDPLERRFPQPTQMPEKVAGIIVLGGAVNQAMTERWGQPSLNQHAERMTVFVALARRYPDARLIYSGGSGLLDRSVPPETRVAQRFFAEQGLDLSRVEFESESRNTYENALHTLSMAEPEPGDTWLLVTSAFHMPRSMACFRAAGWSIMPYPVDYITNYRGFWDISFRGISGMGSFNLALHEWAGIIAYRMMGWTHELFPAPAEPVVRQDGA